MRPAWSAFALSLAATVAAADESTNVIDQNWHQWRGPNATGVAPLGKPPTEWAEDKNVKWKVKIPGDSTATPIIWGDKIFLVTAIQTDRKIEPPADENKDAGQKKEEEAVSRAARRYGITKPEHYYQFVVMCLDRSTGKTLWQHTAKEAVPHEGHHPDGSFASASPTTDGKLLYVSFGSRGVHCYDLDGNPKWSRDFGPMTIQFTFGEGCSPVIDGDSLIVNWDHQKGSFITVLDPKTGEDRWKVERDETTTWATPLVVDYQGRKQLIVSGLKRMRSYDLKSGELIWACGGLMPSAIPSPVSDGKNVYFMTGYLGPVIYAIPLDSTGDLTEADRKNEAKIAWKRKGQAGTPYVPSPLLDGERLYFTQSNKGILSCLDALTGEPIVNRVRVTGLENVYASPVAAADSIYLPSRDGNTLVFKRGQFETKGEGDEAKTEPIVVATNKLDDRFDASPAVAGNAIFLRGRANLYCISAE
jgi:outer membrane protein assembly factor BamB